MVEVRGWEEVDKEDGGKLSGGLVDFVSGGLVREYDEGSIKEC